MGTKWLSCPLSAAADRVFITPEPLSLDRAIARVHTPAHGAVLTFCGVVRDSEDGKPIRSITYEIYDKMARKVIAGIVEDAEANWRVTVSVEHRSGVVPAGETSFIVACAGAHRPEAFHACRLVVDRVKSEAPIWKTAFDFFEFGEMQP